MNRLELGARRRVIGGAVLAALLAIGCASSQAPGGADGSPGPAATAAREAPAAECNVWQAEARDAVSRAVEAHGACAADADCVIAELSADCFDACARPMNAGGQSAFAAARAEANAASCARFAARSCRHVVPPCVPPGRPACRAGRCVLD